MASNKGNLKQISIRLSPDFYEEMINYFNATEKYKGRTESNAFATFLEDCLKDGKLTTDSGNIKENAG